MFKSKLSHINRVSKLFQPMTTPPKNMVKTKDYALSKSTRLMLNLGIIRQSSTGIFHSLPLGVRALDKLKRVVRTRMAQIGAQEIQCPIFVSSDLWKKSGRWDKVGEEIFKSTDRHRNSFIISPTNEESTADLISSIPFLNYKSFPLYLYQINAKFRDEMKPRCGLIRAREFVMKDLYSFDIDEKNSIETYDSLTEVYNKIFEDFGLCGIRVAADPGEIGGVMSHEYHLKCDEGEDVLQWCPKCDEYSLNGPNCKCDELKTFNSLEVGHTFLLSTKYTEPLKAVYRDQNEKTKPLFMGSYGLGLSRILAGSIEVLSNDEEIRWPRNIWPFKIIIVPPKAGSKESSAENFQYEIYEKLNLKFTDDIIIDDRTELTIGKRIIYAKRTGFPFILVIGNKSIEDPPLFELIDTYNEQVHILSLDGLFSFFKTI